MIRPVSNFLEYIKTRPYLSLGLMLLFLSLAYRYHNVLFERPVSAHQWRQADCLSLTENYYLGNGNLCEPEINLLFSDNGQSGKTAGEFPFIYYIVSLIWKLFGQHEFISRLLTIIFSFAGIFALFKISHNILKDIFWSLSVAVLLFSSPIFVYYTNNFLSNVPAFAMMLVACLFFYNYYKYSKSLDFFFSMAFFALAGLLKVSSLLVFCMLIGVFITDIFKFINYKKCGRLFKRPAIAASGFLAVIALVASWYIYAEYYNSLHGGKYTFNSILPFWRLTESELSNAWTSLSGFIVYQIYSIPVYLYLLAIFLFFLWNYKHYHKFWKVSIPLLILGYLGFIMLFTYSLDSHDYYHIDFLIIPIILHLSLLHFLKEKKPKPFNSAWLKTAVGILLLVNVAYTAYNMHLRYWIGNPRYIPLYSKHDYDFWRYSAWAYPWGPYREITQKLRDAGIKREDPVISANDPTFSLTLYFMGQRGWTNVYHALSDSTKVEDKIAKGAKYLAVSDTTDVTYESVKHLMGYPIITHQNLVIYDLKPYLKSKNLQNTD